MRIHRIHELGGIDALRLEEVADLAPGPGEVVIRVAAAGVNFADSLLVVGKYQEKPELPFGPGLEAAGTISAVGAGVDAGRVGERVMAACGINGYADAVVVPAPAAWPIPASMPFVEAGGFPVAYGTSHLGLWHKARLQPGETLAVFGAAGGVGLTAVEIGKAMGARVIAVASSDEKLTLTRQYGADETINSTSEDVRERLKALTGGKGADVIYDPVGGELFEAGLRAINFDGRILTVGYAGGTIPQIPANILLVKSADVLGVHWGACLKKRPKVIAESFRLLMEMYGAGKLKPHVGERFPFEKAADALRHVASRKAQGKVIIEMAA